MSIARLPSVERKINHDEGGMYVIGDNSLCYRARVDSFKHPYLGRRRTGEHVKIATRPGKNYALIYAKDSKEDAVEVWYVD